MTRTLPRLGIRNNAAATLAQMRANAAASMLDPRVWETSRAIIAKTEPRDEVAQAMALRDWLLKSFRFVKDPVGRELLESPIYQLAQYDRRGFIQGDCDDAASLTGALLMSIGIPAQYVAVDIVGSPRGFDHVFTVGYPMDRAAKKRAALEFDVTRPSDVHRVRFQPNAIRVPAA